MPHDARARAVAMRVVRAGAAPLVWVFGALLLAAGSSGSAPPPVAAMPPPPQSQPAPAAARSAATPHAVRAEMVRWFSRAGYRRAQVDALVDYANMESGFRPCAINPAGYRYA